MTAPSRTLTVNMGPQHPAMHGTLRNVLELDGERIVRALPEIGYLHTGFEKLGEQHTYNQFVTTTDRMNYLSPICNNVAFALSAEALMGVEVPVRGQWARVILSELTRISDHVLAVGLMAMDLGAFSVMLWTFVERERLYDIFENVTGTRLTTSWTRVGGVSRELPDDFEPQVRAFVDKFPAVLDELERMLDRNQIWLNRTKGVGVLDKDFALEMGVTGPVLRASGVPYDVRREYPYLTYPSIDFEVPTLSDGDSFARYKQRILEMRQSLRILNQALDRIPKSGPLSAANNKVTLPAKQDVYTGMESLIHHFEITMYGRGLAMPKGESYVATEAPNGELGFYIGSDGAGVPYRVRVRPPSFYNYQIFPYLVEGLMISDAISVLAGLNVIAGELDR
jgi:NADH-quinone oxidoreductase subunit D